MPEGGSPYATKAVDSSPDIDKIAIRAAAVVTVAASIHIDTNEAAVITIAATTVSATTPV